MTVTRVSGEGLKMPAPNEAIIERMARAAYLAIDSWNGDLGFQQDGDWDQSSQVGRDKYTIIARACYASLACNAGAQVKIVKEPTS